LEALGKYRVDHAMLLPLPPQALCYAGLLPRVISGASAGAIVAATIGTRTNEELAAVGFFDG